MVLKQPPIRTVVLMTVSILAITLLENLDYTHPKDDALEQSVTTPNFRIKVTTYHNRHANRCVNIRCGSPETPRTPLKTRCDVMYLAITATLTNKSRSLCAADYVSSQWEAVSRTYNDGIVYISNDVVINEAPLSSQKIHFPTNGTRIRTDWFSLSPFGGGVGLLKQWVKQGKLGVSCDHGAVECHRRVIKYSCDGAIDPRGCRSKGYGASVLKACVMTIAAWMAVWRMAGTARVLTGGKRGTIAVSPVLAGLIVGIVAFAGMSLSDMAWLLARMVGVRYVHLFNDAEIMAGDVYRDNGLRGIYEGYAYVWRDGMEVVKVSGPGVAFVVGWVSIGLFVKRALFDGVLVRCVMAVLGTFCGCTVVEMAMKKNVRKESEAENEYLPVDVARRYAKRGSSRVFVRERNRS